MVHHHETTFGSKSVQEKYIYISEDESDMELYANELNYIFFIYVYYVTHSCIRVYTYKVGCINTVSDCNITFYFLFWLRFYIDRESTTLSINNF